MYAVIRCFDTAMEMSLSAILSPYHRETPSISTIGASITTAGDTAGAKLVRICKLPGIGLSSGRPPAYTPAIA
jgi:hypothetical protein